MKRSKSFSMIELFVSITIILILAALSMVILNKALLYAKDVKTRNLLGNLKIAIGNYYDNFNSVPLPGHANREKRDLNGNGDYTEGGDYAEFSDSDYSVVVGKAIYWKRVKIGLFGVTKLDPAVDNAEILYDDNQQNFGTKVVTHSEAEFDTNFGGATNRSIASNPWYTSSNAPNKILEKERLLSHSSRYLNFYLSNSGLDYTIQTNFMDISNEAILGGDDSKFRKPDDWGAFIRPFKFFQTDSSEFDIHDPMLDTSRGILTHYNHSGLSNKVAKIRSKTVSGSKWYSNYILRNKTNFENELLRRLYDFNDKNTSEQNAFISKYGSQTTNMYKGANGVNKKNFKSDIIIFDNIFWTEGSDQSSISNSYGNGYQKKNSCPVFMKASGDNARLIVDAFNTPVAFVTFANQRREFAETFQSADDKSLSTLGYYVISLGRNKGDDSELGDNYSQDIDTGDDLLEYSAIRTK